MRKNSKKELKDMFGSSDDFFSDVFESIQEGISILDANLTVRYVNGVMNKWYAKKMPLVGKKCFWCYHSRRTPCDPCPSLRCLQSGKMEVEVVPGLSGSPVGWVELFSCPIKEKNTGKVTGVIEFVRDITQRRKMERSIREERDKLIKYLTVAGVMFVALDKKGKVILINKKGCEVLGCKERDILGKNWFDNFLPPKIKKEVGGIFNKLMRGEIKPVEYHENPILNKRGEERIIAWNNIVLTDSDSNIIGTLSSGEDITERRGAEFKLKLTQFAVDRAAIPTFWMGENAKFIYVNDAACRHLGYTRKELLSMTVHDIDPLYNHSVWPQHWQELKEKGHFAFESQHRRKDGSIVPVEISVNYVKFNDKEINFAYAIDITERKQAERISREQKESLEQKNIALREMVEQISLEKGRIKEDLTVNIDELLLPVIKKLKMKGVSKKYSDLLEKYLKDLSSSFGRRITEKSLKLTPKEIEICSMIRSGLTSKDISNLLNTSYQAVEKHRKNIRKKLDISSKDVNLTSFLQRL